MSSRNSYLSPEERRSALGLYQALTEARVLAASGENNADKILAEVKQMLSQNPHTRLDYAVLVDPATLQNVGTIHGSARLAVAAWVGTTRLIDNMLLEVT
jgi:pantoate--beta-alanine ligase